MLVHFFSMASLKGYHCKFPHPPHTHTYVCTSGKCAISSFHCLLPCCFPSAAHPTVISQLSPIFVNILSFNSFSVRVRSKALPRIESKTNYITSLYAPAIWHGPHNPAETASLKHTTIGFLNFLPVSFHAKM